MPKPPVNYGAAREAYYKATGQPVPSSVPNAHLRLWLTNEEERLRATNPEGADILSLAVSRLTAAILA